jgi:hypothetical protein
MAERPAFCSFCVGDKSCLCGACEFNAGPESCGGPDRCAAPPTRTDTPKPRFGSVSSCLKMEPRGPQLFKNQPSSNARSGTHRQHAVMTKAEARVLETLLS